MNPTSEKIYQTALSFLDTDASPLDLTPDELACAETVSDVLASSGCVIETFLSTTELDYFLSHSPLWQKTTTPKRGDVLVSPTGQGGRNGMNHGHTGIVMDNGWVAANNSSARYLGKLTLYYTLKMWKAYFTDLGNYPMNFYALTSVAPPTEAEKIQVATEAVKIATEAVSKPGLRIQILALLQAVLQFLNLK